MVLSNKTGQETTNRKVRYNRVQMNQLALDDCLVALERIERKTGEKKQVGPLSWAFISVDFLSERPCYSYCSPSAFQN